MARTARSKLVVHDSTQHSLLFSFAIPIHNCGCERELFDLCVLAITLQPAILFKTINDKQGAYLPSVMSRWYNDGTLKNHYKWNKDAENSTNCRTYITITFTPNMPLHHWGTNMNQESGAQYKCAIFCSDPSAYMHGISIPRLQKIEIRAGCDRGKHVTGSRMLRVSARFINIRNHRYQRIAFTANTGVHSRTVSTFRTGGGAAANF